MVSLATSGWVEYVLVDIFQRHETKYLTVPIPSQRARWKPAGRQESKLVDLFAATFLEHVYNTRASGGVLATTMNRL